MIRNIFKLSLAMSIPTLLLGGSVMAAEKVTFPDSKYFSAQRVQTQHTAGIHGKASSANTNTVLLRSVNIKGNKAIDSATLKSLISEYIGKRVATANVQQKIVAYYHKEGFLLPVVSINETTENVLDIYVIEGKIHDIDLVVDPKDAAIANNDLLQKYISHILDLAPAKTADVQKYLLLINKIPGYAAEYELAPVSNPKDTGVANLVLSIKKVKATLNLNASNSGNKDLGKELLFGRAKINNPLGYNESIIADIGTSNHPDSLKIAAVGYLKRLNSYGTSASVMGSWLIDNPYRHSTTTPGSAKNDLSTLIKGQVSHYLVLNNHNSFRLDAGVEYHNVSSNIIAQKATKYHYNLGFVKAKITHKDFLNAENLFIPSLFSTLGSAKQTIFIPGSYKFDPNFTFFNFAWYRTQPLFSSNLSLFSQATWQHSNNALPLGQQFLIGSSAVGRTYKSGLVNANKGYDLNLELRYTHKCPDNKVIETLQPYTFFDISHFTNTQAVTNNQTSLSTFNKNTLSGAGAGIRIFFPYGFSGEVEAGVPLTKNLKINNVETKNKNKYSFMLNKTFSW